MVTLRTATRREAAGLLATFLARTPARLDELRAEAADSGGPPPGSLDLSTDSLGPLWEWAAPRFAWRPGYAPPPFGLPGPRVDPHAVEPAATLPEWFDPDLHWNRLSLQSVWLVDGLARYLGECLLREVPGARWTVGRSWRRGYVFQNHPVIRGLPVGGPLQPMWSVSILAARALQPSPGPATPADLVAACTAVPARRPHR